MSLLFPKRLGKSDKDFKFIREAPIEFMKRQLKVNDWNIESRSEPSDIIWENLNKDYSTRYLRKLCIYLSILVNIFCVSVPYQYLIN